MAGYLTDAVTAEFVSARTRASRRNALHSEESMSQPQERPRLFDGPPLTLRPTLLAAYRVATRRRLLETFVALMVVGCDGSAATASLSSGLGDADLPDKASVDSLMEDAAGQLSSADSRAVDGDSGGSDQSTGRGCTEQPFPVGPCCAQSVIVGASCTQGPEICWTRCSGDQQTYLQCLNGKWTSGGLFSCDHGDARSD
jgi:hypothetical protein